MEQLLLHFIGDYIFQNDDMALTKKEAGLKGFLYCAIHCMVYASFFFFITNWLAVFLIAITHFIIDRWNLVGHMIRIKNFRDTTENFGHRPDRPVFVTVWLYIIQDNVIHVTVNYLILKYVVL